MTPKYLLLLALSCNLIALLFALSLCHQLRQARKEMQRLKDLLGLKD